MRPVFPPAPHGFERAAEPFRPAFTAVNGRHSMSPDSKDQKPQIQPGSRAPQIPRHLANGYQSSSSSSVSPTDSSAPPRSPASPNKRRRSESQPDVQEIPNPAPASTTLSAPPQTPLQTPVQEHSQRMDNNQQRTLPPLDRPDAERRWATEPRQVSDMQYRDPRPTEPPLAMPAPSQNPVASVTSPDSPEEQTPTGVTRAGVQVELKKRKRVNSLLHVIIAQL